MYHIIYYTQQFVNTFLYNFKKIGIKLQIQDYTYIKANFLSVYRI